MAALGGVVEGVVPGCVCVCCWGSTCAGAGSWMFGTTTAWTDDSSKRSPAMNQWVTLTTVAQFFFFLFKPAFLEDIQQISVYISVGLLECSYCTRTVNRIMKPQHSS